MSCSLVIVASDSRRSARCCPWDLFLCVHFRFLRKVVSRPLVFPAGIIVLQEMGASKQGVSVHSPQSAAEEQFNCLSLIVL
jgi:hypothetical protein